MSSTTRGSRAPGHAEHAPRAGARLTDFLLLCMALLWGVNFSVVKFGAAQLPPLAFNALRVSLATGVLVAMAVALRAHLPSRGDLARLALLGVLGHGLYQACFILGIARTTVATSALVLAASPALIGVVGRALGSERPDRRAWGGIALQLLGMGGVVLGTAATPTPAGTASPFVGALILLGGATAWACYAVLLKPLTLRVHPIHLSAWTLVGGLPALLVLGAPSLAALDFGAVTLATWGAIAYAGLGAMVLAYQFYYRGVREVGPVRTAMFSNLQPLIAMAVAFLTLREVPTVWQLAGATAIMAGLLVSRPARAAADTPPLTRVASEPDARPSRLADRPGDRLVEHRP